MFKITKTIKLATDIQQITIEAPKIPSKHKPGQFLILRLDEFGERIPLTIFSSDPESGTVTVIVQGIGKTSKTLNSMQAGQYIKDVAGPLGVPSKIERVGTVVVMGGGLGTAVAYPTAKALKDAGNYIISIIGYRTYNLVMLEGEMMAMSDECYITTDDGSYGTNGYATVKLQELIDAGTKIDLVHTACPLPMMRSTANVTRPYNIHTVASLNPIMVDGTGMCGGCRVTIDGKTAFVCVDGPEFDAHKVDFDNLMKRNQAYREFEKSVDIDHTCNLEKVFE
jgi:ferredoxin--NADP+ reductase